MSIYKNSLNKLLKEKEYTLKRIEKVKDRIAEEKENEEAWPGHENTIFLDDINQLEVLEEYLKEIYGQIEIIIKKTKTPL